MICTQFSTKIQVLRFDNGGEYISSDMTFFLDMSGIVYQITCPGILEQNRVVGRKNRHLLKIARALMFTMYVLRTFWSEAVQTTVYLMNRNAVLCPLV